MQNKTSRKNYQIDFIKLFLAVCVFLYHARLYAPSDSVIREVTNKFGWFSVHFFFIISGLFMAAGCQRLKDKPTDNCGKESLEFIWRKIKSLAPLYYVTFAICFVVYYIIHLRQNMWNEPISLLRDLAMKSIPELFMIQMGGVRPCGINSITWYISAMFLAMLPMYYLKQKFPDFFFHILTPLLAILLYGFFYNSEKPFFEQNNFVLIFTGGFLRACCGISFGVIAYMLAEKIKEWAKDKSGMVKITVLEILLTLILTVVWFSRNYDAAVLFPAFLLFPVLLAVIFSGKSYISRFFNKGVFRHCGTISMWIYMNHYVGRLVVNNLYYFQRFSYVEKYLYMAGITMISVIISFVTLKMISKIKCTK